MKKLMKIAIVVVGAAVAAFAVWDQLPAEKKRKYIDATEAYKRHMDGYYI